MTSPIQNIHNKYRFIEFYKRLLLSLLSILVAFVFIEVSIRVWTAINHNDIDEVLQSKIEHDLLGKKIQESRVAADSFNIYYLGESTMTGEPYVDTIPRLIDIMLEHTVDHKELRWVNVAKAGQDFAYSADLAHWILSHKNSTHPSLFVLYAGHNEYLRFADLWGFSISKKYLNFTDWIINHSRFAGALAKRLKLYRLEIDDRSFFDKSLVGLNDYEDPARAYNDQIQHLIALFKENNIPVIISTQVSNYAEFEPNRSVYCGKESDKPLFKSIVDNGLQEEQGHNYQDAIGYYTKALSICGTFAEAYFRLGKASQELGLYDMARNAFEKAVDYDRFPTRATSIQNNYLKNLTQNSLVHVVDPIALFTQQSPNGLVGYNLMMDYAHPNLQGYMYIAQLFAQTIRDMYTDEGRPVQDLSNADLNTLFVSNRKELYKILISRADFMIRISTWRYDSTVRLQKAEEYLDQAISIDDNAIDGYLHKMIIEYIKKNTYTAEGYLQKARNINPSKANQYLQYPWVQQIIIRAMLANTERNFQ